MRMIKAKKFLTTSLMIAMITIGLVSLNQAQVDKRPMITKGGKASTQSAEEREANRLAKEIRHELLTLPWYGVFDWLEGNVTPDGVVTLHGWVVRPTTKTTAEARVKDIEGVTDFKSDIKVLPLLTIRPKSPGFSSSTVMTARSSCRSLKSEIKL